MPKDADQLNIQDITFLRTVRDINENPEDYPDDLTEGGAVPATSTALRKQTGLTDDQLDYRLSEGENSRGFVDEGLIIVHEAEVMENGAWGPKSVELTEDGERKLAAAMDAHGLGDVDGAGRADLQRQELVNLEDDVQELTSEVAALRETMEAIQADVAAVTETVERAEEQDFGFVAGEKETQLQTVITAFPQIHQALDELLGVPMDDLSDRVGELEPEDYQEMRAEVAAFLDEQLATVDETDSGQPTSDQF